MSLFAYPKARHTRTESPPDNLPDYRRYKPYLRREFKRRCVYCRRIDGFASDVGSFGVDHYRPKAAFPHLATVYANLFYCCNPCNTRKGSKWPTGKIFFPNPCDHSMFEHLRYDGVVVKPRTDAGVFAVKQLDLNSPDSLSLRQVVIVAVEGFEANRARYRRALVALRAAQPADPEEAAHRLQQIAQLESTLCEIEEHLSLAYH